MNWRRSQSTRAAALQLGLSIIALCLSTILFAASFAAAPKPIVAEPTPTPPPGPLTVSLPVSNLDPVVPIEALIFIPVTTANIDPSLGYIGFQGDFTFDETVCTFASPFVHAAGLTANGWTVAANILAGSGPIRTFRVSAFVNDGMTPLAGFGTLYQLIFRRVSTTPPANTLLAWRPDPDNFVFIDSNLSGYVPLQTNGVITVCNPGGMCPTPTPTPGISCGTFANSTTITIPATGTSGIASPYPSNITVSGLGGAITKVTVAINGITHTAPTDIDVLLVAPDGRNGIIMSDAGGYVPVNLVNLILDDAAAQSLPYGGFPGGCCGPPLSSGTFRPTNSQECYDGTNGIDTFPEAPVPSGAVALSAFNGANPNGTWSLYVFDDGNGGNAGDFSGGWAVTIATDNCVGPTATPMPTPTSGGATHFMVNAPGFVAGGLSFSFTVTALDEFNNTVTNYPGIIHFTTSDPFPGQMPADTGLNNGTGTFTASLFLGDHTITATDIANPTVTGTSNCISVPKPMTPTPPPPPTPSPPPTPLPTGTPLPTPCGVIFSENFDGVTAPSLPTEWTTAAASGIGPWQTSTENAPSGPNDAMTYESSAGGETVLETPAIAVPAEGGILSFQNHFNLLGDTAPPSGGQATNGMVLDIRINDGAYDDVIAAGGVFLDGGYTDTILCCLGNPLTGRMAWSGFSGNSASYITTTIVLPAATNGQSIKLKWRLGTIVIPVGGIPPSGEVRIDSILITPANCPTPTPSATPSPVARALNLSTRLLVSAGDEVGIGGFIVTGNNPVQVLLRGIGPSLGAAGVANSLADPFLELRDGSGALLASNDNWCESQEICGQIIATGIAPMNELESAIVATLDPGAYTAILSGNNNGTGVGLVEIYDLSRDAASKLGNLSTRASVGTGSDILISGFILGGGTNDDTVLLRGLGPSLIASGVSNVLANPTLELRNADGAVIAMNDDWQIGPTVSLPPSDPLESAIEMALSPGAYTALLSGMNGQTGVGLVEVYALGAPPSVTNVSKSVF